MATKQNKASHMMKLKTWNKPNRPDKIIQWQNSTQYVKKVATSQPAPLRRRSGKCRHDRRVEIRTQQCACLRRHTPVKESTALWADIGESYIFIVKADILGASGDDSDKEPTWKPEKDEQRGKKSILGKIYRVLRGYHRGNQSDFKHRH
uniref:(California timema) hypothetical protein n=1 Tax=Timema californicum TaxID=61474 RepID=A0A7R9PBA2_TIMCA|nr:unnamed protein product [Timema californicum]